jgi:pimeloyl-ACP methyl ester carboxylesterase
MPVDKLVPNDPRVENHTAEVNGKKYHYVLGKPSGQPIATLLLVHGWPDMGFGWRYQVPYFMSLGIQVIVPDMIGYGRTDAPQELEKYSLRSSADDMAALARLVLGDDKGKILLGGHDWGGFLVWRIALWHPELIRAVFSVCTPYTPPRSVYMDPEALVARVPNFRYQIHLAGPEVQAEVAGKERLRQFLNGIYGGRGPAGEPVFLASQGVLFENLPKMGPSPLLSHEEVEFYVEEYSRNGMRGPLNWYRTGKINFEEEKKLIEEDRVKVPQPALMVTATHDTALPPSMAVGMEVHFNSLIVKEVNAHHWALWQAPDEVNQAIGQFLLDVLAEDGVKASI